VTNPLAPFSGDRPTCAKCGPSEARTQWSTPFTECTTYAYGNAEYTFPTHERLCRECGRCGYHWDEATGDPGDATEGPLNHRAVANACRRLYNRWYWDWGRHGDTKAPAGQRLLYELNMALIDEEPDREDPAKGVPLYEFTWGIRIEGSHCRVRVLHEPTGLSHVEEGDAAREQELLSLAYGKLAGTVRAARHA
jgi:hypothetical protein